MLKVLFAASTILVAASGLGQASVQDVANPTAAKSSASFNFGLKLLADNGEQSGGGGNSGSDSSSNDSKDDNSSNDNDSNDDNGASGNTGSSGSSTNTKCDSPQDIAEHPECKS
jgi:hypothetical protein